MNVLARVQRYLKSTGLPPTLFGRLVVNDPRLVGDMRNGRELGKVIRARIEAYIAAHPDHRHIPWRER
jgi:hypothetical protein